MLCQKYKPLKNIVFSCHNNKECKNKINLSVLIFKSKMPNMYTYIKQIPEPSKYVCVNIHDICHKCNLL